MAGGGPADDTLNVAYNKELESVDTYFNSAREGVILSRHVWDGLMYRDPATGEYVGNLATEWAWIDDTTLEVKLRQDVKFHNGEAFTADDVVYTVNFVADEANGVKTQRNVNWLESATKVDEYTAHLHLKAPFPAAIEYLSGPVVMYPDEYYQEVGPQGMALEPVGTGPYRMTEVEPGRRFVMERYEDYHESPKGRPAIGKVVIRTLPDRNTQFAELLRGELDWIWEVPADQAERLAATNRFTVKNAPTMRIGFIEMDAAGRAGDHPFTDLRVRQAVAHAIDRQGMVDALVRGASVVVDAGCYPSQFGCTQEVTGYSYDPAKAKALLAEAGYPDGFKTTFYAYRNRDYAEALLGYLNAVGIETDFQYLKYSALREIRMKGETAITFQTWGSYSINDASAIVSEFFKHGSLDFARDPDILQWLKIADSSIDGEVRKENYAKTLARIAERAYWLPLFSYNTNYVFVPKVEFEPTDDAIPRFFTMSWKGD
ncbi:MAG: ABC transporter substrate-binding protein [Candidatus Competibacterales bacterium]